MKKNFEIGVLLCMVATAASCGNGGGQSADEEPASRRVPITVTSAQTRDLEVWEPSVGQLNWKPKSHHWSRLRWRVG